MTSEIKVQRSPQVIRVTSSDPRTARQLDERIPLALASRFQGYSKIDEMCRNIRGIETITGGTQATDSVLGTTILQSTPEVGLVSTAYLLHVAKRASKPAEEVVDAANGISDTEVRRIISQFKRVLGVPEIIAQHLFGSIIDSDSETLPSLLKALDQYYVLHGIESFNGISNFAVRIADCYCRIAEHIRPPDSYLVDAYRRTMEAKEKSLHSVSDVIDDIQDAMFNLAKECVLEIKRSAGIIH